MDTVDHFNIKLLQDFPVDKTLLEVEFQISLNLHKNGQTPRRRRNFGVTGFGSRFHF